MEGDRIIDPAGVRNNAPDRRVSGLTDFKDPEAGFGAKHAPCSIRKVHLQTAGPFDWFGKLTTDKLTTGKLPSTMLGTSQGRCSLFLVSI